MAWPLANNQIAWTCRADLASRAARNRPARSSRLRCAATCTMLVSHEPRRVNLQAASPPATPAERIIRKPYENKRLVARLKFAALRQAAGVEDVDLRTVRGLDRGLFQKLVAGDWIDRHHNLLIIGPTGVGKS